MPKPRPSPPPRLSELLAGDVVAAAPGLLGCIIARRLPTPQGPQIVRARIVETEAYHQREPGCHAHRGRTPRNAVMFGPPGHLYVYFTYGMWHCANVVCEAEGTAAAVLLRAAAPLPPHDGSSGQAVLRLSGPGLLCQGLQLDRSHSGLHAVMDTPDDPPGADVWLYCPPGWTPPEANWSLRIGLGFAEELVWRCYVAGHPAVSKTRPGYRPPAQRRASDKAVASPDAARGGK